jgi:hypothetical protein
MAPWLQPAGPVLTRPNDGGNNVKHTTKIIPALALLATFAATSFAPPAHAEPDRNWRRGRDGRRVEVVVRAPYNHGRSYFYRDIDTGERDSHISDLRPGYGWHARSARVEKIDIRTGRVLARYVWDQDRWVDCGRDFRVARHDRRGSYHRDWGYGVSYRGS